MHKININKYKHCINKTEQYEQDTHSITKQVNHKVIKSNSARDTKYIVV